MDAFQLKRSEDEMRRGGGGREGPTTGEGGKLFLQVPHFSCHLYQDGPFALGVGHVQTLQLLVDVLLDEVLLLCFTC